MSDKTNYDDVVEPTEEFDDTLPTEEDTDTTDVYQVLSAAGIIPYVQEKDENGNVISERPLTREEFLQTVEEAE